MCFQMEVHIMNKEICVKFTLNKANIYKDGSIISFESEPVKIEKGENVVKFYSLPLKKDDYIRFASSKDYDIVSLYKTEELVNQAEVDAKVEQIKKDQLELIDLQSKLREQNYKLSLFERAFKYEGDFSDFEKLKETVDKYAALTKDVKENIKKLEKESKVVEDRIREATNSVNKVCNDYVGVTKLVIKAKNDATVTFKGSFYSSSIYFAPKYILNTAAKSNEAKLVLKGFVTNRSVIDLNNIHLTFKNNFLNDYTYMPTFNPFDLSDFISSIFGGERVQPRNSRKIRTAMMSLDSAKENVDDTSFTYELKDNVNIIKSQNGIENSFDLTETNLNGTFEYVTLPSTSKGVYLFFRANIENLNLIPSIPFAVLVDGSELKNTSIEINGDELKLSLGEVDYLHVTRSKAVKQIYNMDQNDDHKVEISYVITIENSSDRPVDVKLIEALPTSNDDSIKVKILKPEEKLISKDEQTNTNKLEVVLHLEPKQKQTQEFAYSVEGNFSRYLR